MTTPVSKETRGFEKSWTKGPGQLERNRAAFLSEFRTDPSTFCPTNELLRNFNGQILPYTTPRTTKAFLHGAQLCRAMHRILDLHETAPSS